MPPRKKLPRKSRPAAPKRFVSATREVVPDPTIINLERALFNAAPDNNYLCLSYGWDYEELAINTSYVIHIHPTYYEVGLELGEELAEVTDLEGVLAYVNGEEPPLVKINLGSIGWVGTTTRDDPELGRLEKAFPHTLFTETSYTPMDLVPAHLRGITGSYDLLKVTEPDAEGNRFTKLGEALPSVRELTEVYEKFKNAGVLAVERTDVAREIPIVSSEKLSEVVDVLVPRDERGTA